MKFKFKGTRPSKINVEGKIQLFWNLKGHFHDSPLNLDFHEIVPVRSKKIEFSLKAWYDSPLNIEFRKNVPVSSKKVEFSL